MIGWISETGKRKQAFGILSNHYANIRAGAPLPIQASSHRNRTFEAANTPRLPIGDVETTADVQVLSPEPNGNVHRATTCFANFCINWASGTHICQRFENTKLCSHSLGLVC